MLSAVATAGKEKCHVMKISYTHTEDPIAAMQFTGEERNDVKIVLYTVTLFVICKQLLITDNTDNEVFDCHCLPD